MQGDPHKLGSILRWRTCPFCSGNLTTIAQVDDKRAHYMCDDCSRTHYPHFYIGVNVIIEHGGCVLMIYRKVDPRKGTLDIPGGFVEQDGETPESTARREVLEEVGFHLLENMRLEFVTALPDVYREDEPVISMTYLARLSGARPNAVAASDAVDAHWVRWSEIDMNEVGFESIRDALIIAKEIE